MTTVKTEEIKCLEVLQKCTNTPFTLGGTDLVILEEKAARTRAQEHKNVKKPAHINNISKTALGFN